MIPSIASVIFLGLCAIGSDAFQISPLSLTTRASALHVSAIPEASDDSRRAFVANSVFAGVSFLLYPSMPAHADGVDYKAVASDIMDLVKANPDWGPTLVRLAWHSSGTYDKVSKTGGSGGGTIRFKSELAHGGNAGLGSTAVEWLEPIHSKYASAGLSYADLYTLAGGRCIL